MNRKDIEAFSKRLTVEYGEMITEMYSESVSDDLCASKDISQFYYVSIMGLTSKWLKEERTIYDYMEVLFVATHSLGCPISLVYSNEGDKLSAFFGTKIEYIEAIIGLLKGVFSRITINKRSTDNYSIFQFNKIHEESKYGYGGYIKGNPSAGDYRVSPLGLVIDGMSGRDWCVSIFAYPIKKEETAVRHEMWMTKLSQCSDLQKVSYSETYAEESVSYEKSYQQSKQYFDLIEHFVEKLNNSLINGEWDVTVNYSATNLMDSELLSALLVSSYYGEDSVPEPIHRIKNKENNVVLPNKCVHRNFHKQMDYSKYSSYVSSKELGAFAAFPTREVYGFSVGDYVGFDVDRQDEGNLELGSIIDSDSITNNAYKIDINELNRHCLVAGLTGSGKTNSLKSIIYAASYELDKPFLIIEPAKKEYWEIYKLGFTNLQIFSVGSNEKHSRRLCINPFERACFVDEYGIEHRVPIQTHIDFVYSAFKASFIMYTPMPYVLEKAIYEIYEDAGWNIQQNTNPNGEVYPTMEDLYFKIEDVVNDNGYDTKMKQDLIGSLQARINSMRLGTKGETLNVAKSYPLKQLFNGEVIIELEDIGDDDVKAFIISLILILLLEYRRQQSDSQLELRHLMVIEEAHRLLKNVHSGTGENADPRGAAVEFFCNLLAELRSKGQGFVVADQIPSKLAPDLIKNTNIKIVHRTVAEEERQLLGGSMHMTDEQIDYLASLRQGVAAIYSEGDNRPILVKSNYAGAHEIEDFRSYSREDVLENTSKNVLSYIDEADYKTLTDRQNRLCRLCNKKCTKKYTDILKQIDYNEYLVFAESINPYLTNKCKAQEIDNSILAFLSKNGSVLFAEDIYNRICILNNLIDTWGLEKEYTHSLYLFYINQIRGSKR